MPPEKVSKALVRINSMLDQATTSQQNIRKLLGSLRHVVTCIPSAKPFLQQLSGTRPIDYNIYMDASDFGLCALFPARREYLQVAFNPQERLTISEFRLMGKGDYNINLRELMSAVFASIAWGSCWSGDANDGHRRVRFWIDNTSAIAWNNHCSSRNLEAQRLLRSPALLEVKHLFFVTASHIVGEANTMADAGSRTQVELPTNSRNLSQVWERFCEQVRWWTHLESTTNVTGNNGQPGVSG
ncbi:hypothetical protein PPTG_01056 [Phytophthora nicotianae INRA-310]|uniref:Uncharacterized protein n=1 Tax=Phytophthora nicotianae (strain INRA-310) TaxID=761204 RepID=W2RHM5_PHYN3|nr:hypothetical protein PPTG_01056 [Phytophthora nicotianae INRA-310]ETN24882.1 hypothetical protein PPTG_01056 [Phytophthora nicotianae INRA-310]